MSDMSDADFASYVDRIMACRDAEDAAKADTKLVYAAAADAGIDKTALGLFVRVERMDQSQVAKANRKDELTEEYRARYRRGKASHVRVREAAAFSTAPNASVSEAFDPETGEFSTTPEINEPRNPAPPDGIVDRQPIQPETVKLLGTVASAMATEAGRAALITALDVMIEREETLEPQSPVTPDQHVGENTAARDLASDLIPQGDSGQVATHTLETAEPVHSIEGIKEPKTVAADANAGGLYENAVTTDPIETETADVKSSGLVIENTMKRDGASEASASSVEIAAPIYAEPGIVTREQNGREPMVAHPYATCWPVNTIDVSHGVQKPIVKIGGLILDGRGRYLAARKVHTSPNSTLEYPTVQYDGDDDLADSIRWNIESRPNMSEAALRIVAQKLAKLAPERADEILERMGLAQVSEAAE